MFENESYNDFMENSKEPPSHRISDYVEIAFLILMIMIGAPLNLLAFFRNLSTFLTARRQKRSGNLQRNMSSRLTLFKLHLTIANLMILTLYASSQIFWLSFYQWLGGDAACKLVKFLHTFCFYATSNLVAAIAVDRMYVMFHINKLRVLAGRWSTRRVRICVWTAWILAFLSSVPQFFVWRVIEAWRNWYQCVTVWTAVTITKQAQLDDRSALYEKIYGGMHLMLVFWIPGFIIILCYALIMAKFYIYESRRRREIKDQLSKRSKRSIFSHINYKNLKRISYLSTFSKDEIDGRVGFPRNGSHPMVDPRMGSIPNRQSLELETIQDSPADAPNRHSAQFENSLLYKPLLDSFTANTLRRAKRRTLKKTAWLLLCYIVCWSPYNIAALWRQFFDPEFENIFLDILYNLIVLNAVLNPLIYGV